MKLRTSRTSSRSEEDLRVSWSFNCYNLLIHVLKIKFAMEQMARRVKLYDAVLFFTPVIRRLGTFKESVISEICKALPSRSEKQRSS